MVSREEILNKLISVFRSKNIIDPHITNMKEIEQIKFSDLEYFKHTPSNDSTVKLEDIYQDIITALNPLFAPDQPPTTSPNDYTVFNETGTIGDLADNILDHT